MITSPLHDRAVRPGPITTPTTLFTGFAAFAHRHDARQFLTHVYFILSFSKLPLRRFDFDGHGGRSVISLASPVRTAIASLRVLDYSVSGPVLISPEIFLGAPCRARLSLKYGQFHARRASLARLSMPPRRLFAFQEPWHSFSPSRASDAATTSHQLPGSATGTYQ